MAGTAELGTHNDAEKLVAMLERLTAVQSDVSKISDTLDKVNGTVTDIQLSNVSARERLGALEVRVEHNRTVADGHNLELVRLIREEREAREQSLRAEHEERVKAMAERKLAHDGDIGDLKVDIEAVNHKVDTLADKVADAVTLARVTLFVIGAAAVAVIGAAVTGHISLVLHP